MRRPYDTHLLGSPQTLGVERLSLGLRILEICALTWRKGGSEGGASAPVRQEGVSEESDPRPSSLLRVHTP
jgi:hypothetical protein